eukprot:scaffold2739_cov257-Pinguiococcus_pyrenoidosus.AAC.34
MATRYERLTCPHLFARGICSRYRLHKAFLEHVHGILDGAASQAQVQQRPEEDVLLRCPHSWPLECGFGVGPDELEHVRVRLQGFPHGGSGALLDLVVHEAFVLPLQEQLGARGKVIRPLWPLRLRSLLPKHVAEKLPDVHQEGLEGRDKRNAQRAAKRKRVRQSLSHTLLSASSVPAARLRRLSGAFRSRRPSFSCSTACPAASVPPDSCCGRVQQALLDTHPPWTGWAARAPFLGSLYPEAPAPSPRRLRLAAAPGRTAV